MKRHVLLLLFSIANLYAGSQGFTLYTDSTPVGLGIMVSDDPSLDGKNVFNAIISSPAVVESKKNEKGELYIKLYLNCDVDVVAMRISNKDRSRYKVIQKISFYYDDNKLITAPASTLRLDTVLREEGEPPHLNIHTVPATERSLQEYSIVEISSGKVVSTLQLDYVFPKPEPEMLTINKRTIADAEDRPSDETYYDTVSAYKAFKDEINQKNEVKTDFDPNTHLPLKLVLLISDNSILIRFKRLNSFGSSINFLEYKFEKDSIWKTTVKKDNPFIILRNMPVGKYKLQVRYPHQTDRVWEYEFEIKPVWSQTTSFKVMMGSLITAFFCFILFLINNSRQKRKLKTEVSKRQQLETQITSLRSQLHPHFIFNALSSIQSLINASDISRANLYISKFGSLLHDILEKGNRTMHPLANEIRQMDHYLQLEQLRFNFSYKIEVDESINTSEIDIPLMLLQPFIENAIKHGIIDKREAGVVEIHFEKQDANLMIHIKDSGKGYDLNAKEGHGNTLVKERIAALNKLHKDQQIIVSIQSTPGKGTAVTLTFQNWL